MNIRLLRIQDTLDLEAFLSKHQAQCMFMGNNLKRAGVVYQSAPFQGEYWGHFNCLTAQMDGVIVHYWSGNVMMFAPDPEILKALTASLKMQTQRPVSGVLGPDAQAEMVIKALGISQASYDVNRKEGLYQLRLDDVNAPQILPSFEVREARAITTDLLRQWMEHYDIEALGAPKDAHLQKGAVRKVERLIQGDCWILMKDNMPVSLSAFNARFEDAVQIGPVWTPPEYRNQGFARTLLAHILMIAKKQGAQQAVLFTDHPAAIKAYQAVGFEQIGDYRLALLGEPTLLNGP